MSRISRKTFAKLLIGKSICEVLLVVAVAVGLFAATSSRALRGGVDRADAQTISGWAFDDSNPGRRVEVQLFIDNKFVEQRVANEAQPDVRDANHAADNWHGFTFKAQALPPGEHEARVYAVHSSGSLRHRTLQLIGEPIRFRNGTLP